MQSYSGHADVGDA